jgi:hypothetical protein
MVQPPKARQLIFAIRLPLVVYVALLAFPLRFFAIEPGLDPSWAFALKWFHAQGLKYGEDVAFTWGPLGHLAIAMDINGGLPLAVAAQILGWLIYVAAFVYLAFAVRLSLWRLAGFAVFTYAGVRMFHTFGYAGFDFFLSWLVLLLIGCGTVARRWWIPFGTAVVLAGLLMLMKLSTGIAAVTAVLAYPIGSVLVDRERAISTGFVAVLGLPVVFIAGYLLHNPSFAGMARYIHAGYEISSEHSTILSVPGLPIALYLALALLGCYAVLTAVLLSTRNPGLPLALASAGPLFLEFKHSFIREPGHVEMLFLFMPLVAAVLLLFVDADGRSRRALIGVAVAFAAVLVYSQQSALLRVGAGLQYARPLIQIFRWDSLRKHLKHASQANLAQDRLPPELLARLRDRTVTIFPWESSYAAANELEYRPFPIFQSYDAYTPFLDAWNAEFFEDLETAPEFVIFDWDSIDGRHPLLDVPQTALALYRHYGLDGVFGKLLLLRRLPQARFPKLMQTIQEGTFGVGEKLAVSHGINSSVVHLQLKWNIEGALKKFFWRLPEVRWIAAFADGSTLAARIPPAVVAGGVSVDLIPAGVEHMRQLYSGEPGRQVESIFIAGEGAKYLNRQIHYELATLQGPSIRPVPAPDVSIVGGLRGDCKIDFVNDAAVQNGSVSVASTNGYFTIRGWAIAATGVLLRIDGRLRRAQTGISRNDVVAAHRLDASARPGFELTIPTADLSSSRHTIEVLASNSLANYQLCAERAHVDVVKTN